MLRRAVNDVDSGFVHVISAVTEVSNWNNSLVPVRLSRRVIISHRCGCTPRKTTLSVGAGVHRARQCADGHGARCQAMVVSMGMFVLMFVAVSLSRFVHVHGCGMLMRMRAFHEWCSFQKNLFS